MVWKCVFIPSVDSDQLPATTGGTENSSDDFQSSSHDFVLDLFLAKRSNYGNLFLADFNHVVHQLKNVNTRLNAQDCLLLEIRLDDKKFQELYIWCHSTMIVLRHNGITI